MLNDSYIEKLFFIYSELNLFISILPENVSTVKKYSSSVKS